MGEMPALHAAAASAPLAGVAAMTLTDPWTQLLSARWGAPAGRGERHASVPMAYASNAQAIANSDDHWTPIQPSERFFKRLAGPSAS